MRLLLTTLSLMLVLVLAGCNQGQATPATPAAIPTEAGAPLAPEATLPAGSTEQPAPATTEQAGAPYPPPGLVATPGGNYPAPAGENSPAPGGTPTP
ncbi:MAG: hypothetical protein M5U01_12275 [Ardenticatenaceae bacterium]|nr:hypothetical protein [Ardenticatenaceae bacterium]HBY96509.1 hypothetical protein [Chloroflexota bacterium]